MVLTFIIDFFSFHDGLKHLCSLKLVPIIRATSPKVVIKCKSVMFFTFWALFLKIFIFEVPKFDLTKYQISNQLTFSSESCTCKIHVKSHKISGLCHPYLMDCFEIFTSGRCHRDLKDLKISASNSKHFRIYSIFKKFQIGVPRMTF